ncbi:hypothetical protein ACWD48_12400 [Streptomyces sp. NPDC002519]
MKIHHREVAGHLTDRVDGRNQLSDFQNPAEDVVILTIGLAIAALGVWLL